MKIKTFRGRNCESLDTAVNKFLEEHKLVSLHISTVDLGNTVMGSTIWYTYVVVHDD